MHGKGLYLKLLNGTLLRIWSVYHVVNSGSAFRLAAAVSNHFPIDNTRVHPVSTHSSVMCLKLEHNYAQLTCPYRPATRASIQLYSSNHRGLLLSQRTRWNGQDGNLYKKMRIELPQSFTTRALACMAD